MYVEGLVHITELGGEYFKFDEARQELRGERTGIRYAVGTRVQVQVSRVDLDGRKIDFRLIREGEDLAARAPKDKSASREGREPGRRDGQQRREDRSSGLAQTLKAAGKKAAAKNKGRSRR
jgi:ribonuclease R